MIFPSGSEGLLSELGYAGSYKVGTGLGLVILMFMFMFAGGVVGLTVDPQERRGLMT